MQSCGSYTTCLSGVKATGSNLDAMLLYRYGSIKNSGFDLHFMKIMDAFEHFCAKSGNFALNFDERIPKM